MKKATVAFILWFGCFIGLCGLHRFYVGRYWTGFLWLFTLGLLGLGQLFDLFFLGSMVRQANLLKGLTGYGMGPGNVVNSSNSNTVAPVINVHVNAPQGHPAASPLESSSVPVRELPKAG